MRSRAVWLIPLALGVGLVALLLARGGHTMPENFAVLAPDEAGPDAAPPTGPELATFGAGCFWCTEAVFQQLKGVQAVESGYSGGTVQNPTYEQVCTGTTGHAEVTQITFDP